MDFTAIAKEFGVPTAFLAVMVWLYLRKDEDSKSLRVEHREERKEWRDSSEKLHQNMEKTIKELTQVIRDKG